MTFSQNIHPDGKWERVEAMVWGPNGGSCFRLVITDENNRIYDLTIHYGDEKNRNDFIFKLKEAISKLPVTCSECGKPMD